MSVFELALSENHEFTPKQAAYIGDGVFELLVRQWMLRVCGAMAAKAMHRHTIQWVCHSTQSLILDHWKPALTDDELEWVRRGRNVALSGGKKSGGKKNRKTDPAQQRQATAFEALLGYWHHQSPRRLIGFNQWLRSVSPDAFNSPEQWPDPWPDPPSSPPSSMT